jgi:hypothetical protein
VRQEVSAEPRRGRLEILEKLVNQMEIKTKIVVQSFQVSEEVIDKYLYSQKDDDVGYRQIDYHHPLSFMSITES